MRINLLSTLKVSMTIVGTTIGAGFASGREIWEFFGSYGESSYPSIFLSMVIFYIASMILLTISWKRKTEHYSELLEQIMGKSMARIFDGLVTFSLLTTTIVMIAGSGATFEQWQGEDLYLFGCLILVLAVFIALLFETNGMLSLNMVIMPVLIVILIYVCLQFSQSHSTEVINRDQELVLSWPSAVAYAAFNIISLLAVLSTVGRQIRHSWEIWTAGLISVICLGGVAILYNHSLLKIEHLISQYDIPLFALVEDYSPIWMLTISLLLWFAIFTTTLSNMHGLIFRLSPYISWPRWLVSLSCLLLLTPLSQLGFATLVQYLYPLYGVCNLFLLASILMYPFSKQESKEG
ncbi:YkvI family membrane protein [Hazenella coriacea]|uniref:Putative membrane protein YkvI n=1 Tax=Hazenella coriacea TaxID=1179467 RepID=A0A4R3LDE2_9BACL|nr:hypothetical protein [Hazenella coriacea]TCS95496.1 putative membrane protein YkvI [Hazenella coriacea]